MKHIFLLLSALLMLTASIVQAQESNALILYADHAIWAWQDGSDGLQHVDFCGTPERQPIQPHIALSPDGNRIVYLSQPEIVTDAIERTGGFGGGDLPSDIWVCNLDTQTRFQVANQPMNAALFAENGDPDNFVVRGFPTWSPDGTQLAWTEFSSFDDPMRLVTYDIETDSLNVLVDELPAQYGIPSALDVVWGETGIGLISWEYVADSDPRWSVIVYDAEQGFEIGSLDFPDGYGGRAGEGVRNIFWTKYISLEGLTMLFNDGHFEVFSPEIGVAEQIEALELYSLTAPEGTMSLVYGPFLGDGNSWAVREGETFTSLPIADEAYNPAPDGMAISPAGDAIAYVSSEDGQIYIWRDGMAAVVPETIPDNASDSYGLAWGAVGWREFRDQIPQLGMSADPITCEGFLPSRLVIDGTAQVVDDEPNNIRQEPATGSPRIGQIPPDGEFNVLAGPVCGEDLAWWQVDYNGIVGWTAEGMENEYWLEPLS